MVAMVTELSKLGVHVEEGRDYLIVHGVKVMIELYKLHVPF